MIVVVPARGGSKGLPRKNLLVIDGKPLIAHTLECALASQAVERVIVSTDDDEIASYAYTFGRVEVPFMRPPELASDEASAIDVYLHAGRVLGVNTLCALLPTAPLRTHEDVEAAIALYRSKSAKVVLSVARAKPASWQQTMSADGRMGPVPGVSASIANRQEFGTLVAPNGAIYVLDLDVLAERRTYFGSDTWGHLMPADRSIDIDGMDDFRIAEALLKARRRHA